MKIELVCECCRNTFIVDYKYRDKKYCSRDCYFTHVRNGNKSIGRLRDDSTRETRTCLECGNEFIERKKHKKTLCSDECRLSWSKKPENTENLKNKIKDGVLKKYGVEHVWKVSDIHKKTMENRDRESAIIKQKNTVREKHLINLKSKLSESKLTLLDDYSRNKSGNTSLSYNFSCNVCNRKFQSTLLGCGRIPKCPKCFPTTKNNKIETFITEFLDSKNIEYITNTRKIISKELDIFIPKYNLAIEVNGLYWHGELNGKDKNYHLNKTQECDQKNIRLLQIFEDEIINTPDIVLSKLSNILGLITNKIYARKCSIRIVDTNTKKSFLNKNHIQGDTRDTIRIGLYHGDELVSLMTLSKRKITRGNPTWEIVRFCSKTNLQVVGGFSKLFKFFIKNYNPEQIITFADLRWSNYKQINTVYNNNGFQYVSHTKPSYWYFYRSNNDKKYHRFSFRKDVLVKAGFDPNKTEWEIMQERGFDRIWDCGNLKFIYNT